MAPPAEGSGPALAVTSDALWTRSSSEKTRDLAASDSDATRLRLGLEGSYRMALEGGGDLTPKLEIGMRHDGGDAETGFGVELGGGVAWSAPALGLSLDVSGRTLIAHGNDDLKDRGYAASLAFDPDSATQRGPSLSLRQEFGGQAQGGLDALFAPNPLEDRTGSEATSRWNMEAAYGLPAFGGRWTRQPACGPGARHGCARLQPRLAADAGGRERARPVVRPPGDPPGERHGAGGAHGRGQHYRALVSHGARGGSRRRTGDGLPRSGRGALRQPVPAGRDAGIRKLARDPIRERLTMARQVRGWDPVRAWRFIRASKAYRNAWEKRWPQPGLPERAPPGSEAGELIAFRCGSRPRSTSPPWPGAWRPGRTPMRRGRWRRSGPGPG